MFACVSPNDHAVYDTYVIDPLAFSIDPMGREQSNINIPSTSDVILMMYLKRYLGRFFPSIFNSLTCAAEFMTTEKGAATYELYTSTVS